MLQRIPDATVALLLAVTTSVPLSCGSARDNAAQSRMTPQTPRLPRAVAPGAELRRDARSGAVRLSPGINGGEQLVHLEGDTGPKGEQQWP